MELKDYTTEELKVELKRRTIEAKAKQASTLRCRMCKYWGAIDYWGNPVNHKFIGSSFPCQFFKTKNGKYYRCHSAAQIACENFKKKEE